MQTFEQTLYVPIIKDSPVYPVVLDAEETVLSLPPIINGSISKITLDTTNVFIECTRTAMDLTKANAREGWYYTIRELKEENGHPSARTYFPGTSRAAEVMLTKPGEEETKSIGTFGILHPEVLSNFDVLY